MISYHTNDITKRAEESSLWKDVETQKGNALPYLLERYLLLENWRYRDRLMDGGEGHQTSIDVIQFLHLLMAESVTVLLAQEERIRKLEAAMNNGSKLFPQV